MTLSVARFYTTPRAGSPIVVNPDPDPDPEPVTIRSVGNAPGCYDRKTFPANTSSAPGWAGKFIRGNYVKGFVLDTTHSGMENAPVGGGEPTWKANNELDVALTQTQGTHPDGQPWTLGLKARVQMGRYAGSWIMDAGGPRITGYYNLQQGFTATIPRIYSPGFVDEHVEFRTRLAAKYGKDPRLLDMAFEGPMNIYAEHYIQQTAKQQAGAMAGGMLKETMAQSNRDKLMAAGYTPEQHLVAIQRLQATAALFDCSTSEALNPAQRLDNNGNPTKSLAFTMDRASELEALIGARACLGNNSMRADATWPTGSAPGEYIQQWEFVRDSNGSKYYQTANTDLIDTNGQDLYTTCLKACEMGAWMIELPGTTAQYTNSSSWGMSPAEFDDINARCAANVSLYPAVSP